VAAGAAAVEAAGVAGVQGPGGRFRKGICQNIFPKGMSLEKCFEETKKAGFDGIEFPIGGEIKLASTAEDLKRVRGAARASGVEILALWASEAVSENWLNHPDPAARARGVEGLKRAIEIAQAMGVGALLTIPGRVGSGARLVVGYDDTWKRSTEEMHKVVPAAAQAKVALCIENVWNKFLVSPLEMRAFVDQFKSPWVQAFFDIGNVMQFGYPEDWILTLGRRVRRVHLKDYKLSARAEQGRFVGLLEGDVNWKAVMAALVKVDYRGWLSPEIGHDPNDPDQLKKLSGTVDQILALA
jgi:hexulose-6-phosphate isomerase